jgi:hypothetical protein
MSSSDSEDLGDASASSVAATSSTALITLPAAAQSTAAQRQEETSRVTNTYVKHLHHQVRHDSIFHVDSCSCCVWNVFICLQASQGRDGVKAAALAVTISPRAKNSKIHVSASDPWSGLHMVNVLAMAGITVIPRKIDLNDTTLFDLARLRPFTELVIGMYACW